MAKNAQTRGQKRDDSWWEVRYQEEVPKEVTDKGDVDSVPGRHVREMLRN